MRSIKTMFTKRDLSLLVSEKSSMRCQQILETQLSFSPSTLFLRDFWENADSVEDTWRLTTLMSLLLNNFISLSQSSSALTLLAKSQLFFLLTLLREVLNPMQLLTSLRRKRVTYSMDWGQELNSYRRLSMKWRMWLAQKFRVPCTLSQESTFQIRLWRLLNLRV